MINVVHPFFSTIAFCARAEKTVSAPSPASRTYAMKARDFHLPARWIYNSDAPYAANWVAPPILPECVLSRIAAATFHH